jgi:hypothetical protein
MNSDYPGQYNIIAEKLLAVCEDNFLALDAQSTAKTSRLNDP